MCPSGATPYCCQMSIWTFGLQFRLTRSPSPFDPGINHLDTKLINRDQHLYCCFVTWYVFIGAASVKSESSALDVEAGEIITIELIQMICFIGLCCHSLSLMFG